MSNVTNFTRRSGYLNGPEESNELVNPTQSRDRSPSGHPLRFVHPVRKVERHMSQRLMAPMIRENGQLREASWDEALDRAAAGFRSVVEAHGPTAFGMFSCSKTTNEVNYAAQRFTRTVIGSNNIDSCNRT